MANGFKLKISSQNISRFLNKAKRFIFSRRVIPIFKGTLAYTTVLILVLSYKFDSLTIWPANFQNALIPTIVAATGQPIGACLQASFLVLLGIVVGSANFAAMANLARWPVAQGILFTLTVYVLAYFKARDARLFIVFLVGILMGFDGILNSVNSGNRFLPKFLLADAASYLFGLAVALVVNILVFPKSSEKEFRQMLVTSLGHMENLSNLIAKAYAMVATDEEMEMGDLLMQTIRADFAFLSQLLDNTSVEINWSRYSMEDYRLMTQHVRGIQRAMFRGFNALRLFDLADKQVVSRIIIPESRHFIFQIRRDINNILQQISIELDGSAHIDQPVQTGYDDFLSTEREAARIRKQYAHSGDDEPEPVDADAEKLDGIESGDVQSKDVEKNLSSITADSIRAIDTGLVNESLSASEGDAEAQIKKLKEDYAKMQQTQTETLQSVFSIIKDCPYRNLKVEEKLPSLLEKYGQEPEQDDPRTSPSNSSNLGISTLNNKAISSDSGVAQKLDKKTEENRKPRPRNVKRSMGSRTELEQHQINLVQRAELVQLSRSLSTVYTLFFSTEIVITEVEKLYNVVKPMNQPKRRKRLHMHLFPTHQAKSTQSRSGRVPSLYSHDDPELGVKEALAILENQSYMTSPVSLWQRIDTVNQFLKTDQSVYAFKTAAISSVFLALFYSSTTRLWFNSFGMQASLLATLVAFEPTLGQSFILLVTQILGSGLGTLSGLIILEIFRNVGGYTFNPYGICALTAVWALPFQYIIYEKPKFFIFGLLALASCGALIIHEAVLVNYARVPFDSPALQTGKAFAQLAIALGLVLIFQLFILRTPARKTLRIAMGQLVYSTLAYATMSQAYVKAVLQPEANKVVPIAAIRRVERELIQRENQIISDMLGISSLIVAAAAEPSSVAWRPYIPSRLLQAMGLLIDRFSDARIALGSEAFDPFILESIVAVLSPYRRRAHQMVKLSLYLSATSLLSKSPLPHDAVGIEEHLQDFIEDAVIISAKIADTEQGAVAVKEDSFARFWFYILCVGDMPRHLKEIELVCKDMFGSLEDDPKMK